MRVWPRASHAVVAVGTRAEGQALDEEAEEQLEAEWLSMLNVQNVALMYEVRGDGDVFVCVRCEVWCCVR